MRLPRGFWSVRRISLLWPFLILIIIGAALTALLPSVDEQRAAGAEGLYQKTIDRYNPARVNKPRVTLDVEEEFTIVMQTYNRTDILLRLLNHYQAAPHLRRMIIVWNNIGEETPKKLWDSYGPHPVPVLFKEQSVNRMRNRLQAFPEIDTEAVLMLDDDIQLSVPDISFALSVWKQFPDQIVGFVPRRHVTSPGGVHSYGSFELQDPGVGGGDRYSMILIGVSFFHRQYLQLFQDQPKAVHELVDATQNCDDIAMNFAVAHHLGQQSRFPAPSRSNGRFSRPSGVFVKPMDLRTLEKDASSKYLGMWHRPEHFLQRSYCLNQLAKIYRSMPLQFSNLMINQFGFPSYANHKTKN